MGIFDLGRAAYYGSAVHNAAREGARYGSIYPDDPAGIEAAVHGLAIGLDPDDVTITLAYPDTNILQVTVEYDMPIITPLIGSFFGGGSTVRLGSQATMNIER